MLTIEQLQEKRASKQLQNQIRYRGTVYTWQELLDSGMFVSKFVNTQRYASKKRNGCYAELKTPKVEYMLRSQDDCFIDCPKLVWDCANLPETAAKNMESA